MTETGSPNDDIQNILPITIEEEMKRSYLDYAMSVIVSRAIPDVRDGLKPVHRRIFFSMHEAGYTHDKTYRKSARVVGDVMGKYHPHGDTAIYDAMVRMAQDFSMRLPLIDGQGNFGSMDGDSPAAMRYTEARMALSAEYLLADIDKDTVDFQDNYDGTTSEPVTLPARYPNLLVNGGAGIAVGMATNIPPHNLGEVLNACMAMIANPAVTDDELIELVPGPDFPTGGIILGRAGMQKAYREGRGSVPIRSKTHIEENKSGRESIVLTEIPYAVNKSRMIEQIAECVRSKRIEGIAELRDESDREGVRVVIDLKRDAQSDVVLNQLFRFTQMQTSFGMNMLALNGGRPETLTLKQILDAFLKFREEVITRRTRFELGKARERAHVLAGLAIAVANIDEVIRLIRAASDPVEAREALMSREWPAHDVEGMIKLVDDPSHQVIDGKYRLSETQARAILDMRLQRLTALEQDRIQGEMDELAIKINDFLEILSSRPRLIEVMSEELLEVRDKFATPRRTEISDWAGDQDDEDLIPREDMVVTLSYNGYIKRVPLTAYRAQRRGGKGRSGMATRDEDFVSSLFVANTHTPMLFFSSKGMAYKMKVYRLPLGNPAARGKAAVNVLPLDPDETISTVMPLPEDEDQWENMYVMFATKSGGVRRNRLSDFVDVRSNGKIAMKLNEGDELIGVSVCGENDDILLSTWQGKAMRFPVTDVRVFAGRTSTGVRGINLAGGDHVISMAAITHMDLETDERDAYLKMARAARGLSDEDGADNAAEAVETAVEVSMERYAELSAAEQFLLTITENGYGKRTSAYEYRTTKRGGKGIDNAAITSKNGNIVASFPITDDQQIMAVTDGGKLIRTPVHDVRIAARKTQGVILFRTAEDETVVSVSMLDDNEDDDAENENGLNEEAGDAPENTEGGDTAGDAGEDPTPEA